METADVELTDGGAGLEDARHGGNGDGSAAVAQASGRRPVAHGSGRTRRDGRTHHAANRARGWKRDFRSDG